MLFLKIYIGFSVFTFVMLLIQCYLIVKDLKRQYPDIANKYSQHNKTSALENILTWTKIFVACFFPIVNIGILYSSLFGFDEVKEKTLEKYKMIIKEGF